MPRHPPFALNNLTTENKMLASTVQFSTNDQPTTHRHPPNPATVTSHKRYKQPGHAWTETTTTRSPQATTPAPPASHGCSFRTQQGAHRLPPAAPTPVPPTTSQLPRTRNAGRCRRHDSPVSPPSSTPPPHPGGAGYWTSFPAKSLLRKEVIQPHLPVRLPCYDFVPIASPTFDHSLPHRLGHGLRVLPTFVT